MTYKNEWTKLEDIEELYDNISKNALMSSACSNSKAGIDVSHWYKQTGTAGKGSLVYINVGYLKYVYHRRRKIQFDCQDKYFKLMEIMSETKLIKLFSKYCNVEGTSINGFMTRTLFANHYTTPLSNMSMRGRMITFSNFCDELLEPISFDSVEEEYDYYEAKRIMKCRIK